MSRWDICLVICVWWKVCIDATVQFSPVEPTTQGARFWLCAGGRKQKNVCLLKNGGCESLYKLSPFCGLCTKSDIICSSPPRSDSSVFSRTSLSGPVQSLKSQQNQKVQKNKQTNKQNKAPRRRKTVDSICQSSKGTQSEWWIYDLFLSLVCFQISVWPVLFASGVRKC